MQVYKADAYDFLVLQSLHSPVSHLLSRPTNRVAQRRPYRYLQDHIDMCFIYPQCDQCRWPEINNIRSVKLCDAFEKLAHDRDARVAVSGPDPSPGDLARLRCLDLYTFVRQNGANYEIWMQRECLRWSPELRSHLCKHCEERNARLDAAFQLATDQLMAEQADHAESQATVTLPLLGLRPAIQEPVHQSLGFDPSETDAETNVDWEMLMGPSPLRS